MKKKVEIVCILDRSGSMSSIMSEAVASLNSFIEGQKELPGKVKVTLVAFDDQYEIVLDRVKLNEVPVIKVEDVRPRGMTALNDAIGKTINNITAKNVVLLIQTDGFENASQEYNTKQVRDLIEAKKDAGWDISFIGAGIDAFATGSTYGIVKGKCLSIDKTAAGMENMRGFSAQTSFDYRSK